MGDQIIKIETSQTEDDKVNLPLWPSVGAELLHGGEVEARGGAAKRTGATTSETSPTGGTLLA
jgi:hypothetical protein